jgi:molecular chaperone GrpE
VREGTLAEFEDPGKRQSPDSIRVTDRRLRFDDPASGEPTVGEPAARYPSFVAELKEKALSAETKLAEALNLLRRREAEADDFRARLRREMERRSRTEMENWLKDILEVLDSLDRGIAAATDATASPLREGLVTIRDQFLSILARHGVQPMDLLGTTYDPHLAEAIAISPSPAEGGESRIVQETRRGYMLDGGVLRPAQVRVARSSPDPISAQEVGSDPSSER